MRYLLILYFFTGVSAVPFAQRVLGPSASINVHSGSNRTLSELPASLLFFEGFDNVSVPSLPTEWTSFSIADQGFVSGTSGTEIGQTNSNGFWAVPNHGLFVFTNDDACNCDKSADRLRSPTIDLAAQSHVRIGFSAFQNGSGPQRAWIQAFSTDGSWIDLLEIPPSPRWENYSIDLPSDMLHAQFQFRFRYDDLGNYASGLAIDDVYLTYAPSENLKFKSFTSTSSGLLSGGTLYDEIPLILARQAHLLYKAEVENESEQRKNSKLAVSVLGPLQFNDTTGAWILDPFEQETIQFQDRETFTPYAKGAYTLSAELISDSLDGQTSDNSFTTNFQVVDTNYQRIPHVTDGTGIIIRENLDRIGTAYTLFQSTDVEAVWIGIHPACEVNSRFRVKFFNINTLTSSVFSTSPYIVKTGDLGKEVRVPIDHSFPQGHYVVVVEHESGQIALSSTSRYHSPAGVSFVQKSGQSWSASAYYPFIRLILPAIDSSCSGYIHISARDESCLGNVDGQIMASLIDAPLPHTYAWSTGSSAQQITALSPSVYQLFITDGDGCIYEQNISIHPGSSVVATPLITLDSCERGVGQIELMITGGLEPYSIYWNGSQGTEKATGLESGSYNVSIADYNGCSTDTSITVSASEALNASISVLQSSCGVSNGRLSLQPFGADPFAYEWNTGSTNDTITNISSGIYAFTVTDSIGCTLEVTTILADSNAPSVSAGAVNPPACIDTNLGSITAIATGGSGTLTYAWSNGQATATASGLSAGTYSLTVSDQNGCRNFLKRTLTLNSHPLRVDLIDIGENCYHQENGSLVAIVSGGKAPYTYHWSTGSNLFYVESLASGNYTLTVNDLNDCQSIVEVTLHSRPAFFYTVDSVSFARKDTASPKKGSIYLSTFGGTPPYSFQWSNGFDQEDLTNADSGTYTVVISDQLGCVVSFENTFGSYPLSIAHPLASDGVHIFPNPVQSGGRLYIRTEKEFDSAILTDLHGRILPAEHSNSEVHAPILPTGVYVLRLMRNNVQVSSHTILVSP